MAERLHFNTGMAYESMLAAEHLARYWLLKEACVGKRVLDVACGEGYGSSLLRQWGASSVVGVDISEDAIANANERFGAPGITYVLGDACNLGRVLAESEQFDLIVSFETLEHVPDVPGLLRGMRSRLASDGSIVISCPNDPEVMGDQRNEFHLETYTLNQFQTVTAEVLGEATQWLLGTPVIGFGVCDATDRWAQGAGVRLSAMLEGSDAVLSRFLPAQAGHGIDGEKAHFYMGVWGEALPRALVAAPIAHRAYVGPWNSWVAAREENERLLSVQARQEERHTRETSELARELDAAKAQVAAERSARLLMASKLHERDQRLQQLTGDMNGLTAVVAERDALLERLRILSGSRGHRWLQRYYRLYEYGATAWIMRRARRVVGAIRRWTR